MLRHIELTMSIALVILMLCSQYKVKSIDLRCEAKALSDSVSNIDIRVAAFIAASRQNDSTLDV